MKSSKSPRAVPILPRVIRLRDAAHYLGMDKNRFNKDVRPYLREVSIGVQGVAFDRLDLDAWFEHHMRRSERSSTKRYTLWDAQKPLALKDEAGIGTLINESVDSEFKKALALIHSKKRSAT